MGKHEEIDESIKLCNFRSTFMSLIIINRLSKCFLVGLLEILVKLTSNLKIWPLDKENSNKKWKVDKWASQGV